MSDSTFKLQLLVRAELALAKFHARRTLFRTAVIAAAMVFLLMGLGMLNFAAYLSLLDKVSPGLAALLVAAGDALCAFVIYVIGQNAGPSEAEEKMAQEIRDMAYTEVGKDIEDIRARVDQLTGDVKKISTGVSTVMGTIKFFVAMLSKSGKKQSNDKSE